MSSVKCINFCFTKKAETMINDIKIVNKIKDLVLNKV